MNGFTLGKNHSNADFVRNGLPNQAVLNLMKELLHVKQKPSNAKSAKTFFQGFHNWNHMEGIVILEKIIGNWKPGKCFACYTTLKTHIKVVHDEIKEHKCDQCETTFNSNAAKQNHIRNYFY